MKAEILNKIIQYMVKQPYSEVYELMDELREEIKGMEQNVSEESPAVEEVDQWQ